MGNKRKRLGTGANNLENFEIPKTEIKQNSENEVAESILSKKISFKMKANEYFFFKKMANLNNTTLSGELHRALAEYMRKHPF